MKTDILQLNGKQREIVNLVSGIAKRAMKGTYPHSYDQTSSDFSLRLPQRTTSDAQKHQMTLSYHEIGMRTP